MLQILTILGTKWLIGLASIIRVTDSGMLKHRATKTIEVINRVNLMIRDVDSTFLTMREPKKLKFEGAILDRHNLFMFHEVLGNHNASSNSRLGL